RNEYLWRRFWLSTAVRSTVELVASARRELRELPEHIRREMLDLLAAVRDEDPGSLGRKLAGNRDHYRIRVVQYRLVYKATSRGRVVVTRIRPRSEVYGGM